MEYSTSSDPVKYCSILHKCHTLYVKPVPVPDTTLQYGRRALPWGARGCLFFQHSCTSCYTIITCTCLENQLSLLQDYTITTCTGVFISLKLVQYLSRSLQWQNW